MCELCKTLAGTGVEVEHVSPEQLEDVMNKAESDPGAEVFELSFDELPEFLKNFGTPKSEEVLDQEVKAHLIKDLMEAVTRAAKHNILVGMLPENEAASKYKSGQVAEDAVNAHYEAAMFKVKLLLEVLKKHYREDYDKFRRDAQADGDNIFDILGLD